MYTRILLPLDGSKTAEKVLPYGRFLASTLKLPVELLTAIDIAEIAKRISAEKAPYLNTLIENNIRTSEQYLSGIARKLKELHAGSDEIKPLEPIDRVPRMLQAPELTGGLPFAEDVEVQAEPIEPT